MLVYVNNYICWCMQTTIYVGVCKQLYSMLEYVNNYKQNAQNEQY